MSKFLVTGGAGFIGSHIVQELLGRGHSVRVLDNFSSGSKDNLLTVLDKIELLRADIRSKKKCLEATCGIDYVLHQAALRSVPRSMLDPASYDAVNIGGTLNMLEAARRNKVRCFVFASSSSVYGLVKRFPQKESFSPDPISPYALSKLAGEHYCRIFSRHFSLPTVSLRYFNVFGPRQSLDDEYSVVIPKFISCMLRGSRPPIYGSGRQSRDFTFVSNVVDANILAARLTRPRGEVVNVASGRNYTILGLVEILNRLLGKKIKPIFLAARAGDVYKTLADLSLAEKRLRFYPNADFISGLKRTIEYFKNG